MEDQGSPRGAFHDEIHNFEIETKEPVKTIRVFIASIAINLSSLSVGTTMSWTSPVLPKLIMGYDSPLNHTVGLQSAGWIASVVGISASITPFIAGLLADKIGRKIAILSSALVFSLGYLLMILASEVWMILLGRLLNGCGIGFVMSVVPMYVGEISTDNVRGAAGSLMSFFIATGIFGVQCIGPYVSYYTLQYFCLTVPVVFFVVFSFMPESPYYSLAQGKKLEAQKALEFLRGQSTAGVQKELIEIENLVKISMAQKGTILDIITNTANRKALLICLGLILFQQVSGINAVIFNSQSIFESANMGLNGATAAIVCMSIQLITSGVTPLFADRFDRKAIFLTSAVFMAIALALLGLFFFVKIELGYGALFNWLPLPALVLYIIMFTMGFGPLPWTVLSEMFAPNVKPMAASLGASMCWIVGFFIALFYPTLQALGVYIAFWIFAFFCVVACFFTVFIVMETRGLSLQEIQNRLNK